MEKKATRYVLFGFVALSVLAICFTLVSYTSSSKLEELEAVLSEKEQKLVEYELALADLREQISSFEKELEKANKQISETQNESIKYLSMLYVGYMQSKRLVVEDNITILAYPGKNAPVVNTILPYSIVEVEDAVSVEGDLWLYITIPVYDTPMNYKGWIKEDDTIEYSLETQSLVKGDIYILKGTNINGSIIEWDMRGRITEIIDDTALIFIPGGATLEVNIEDIVYPQID